MKEYNRQKKRGRDKFFCCQSHASIANGTVHTDVQRMCLQCGKEFTSSTRKQHQKCCCSECARKYSRSHVNVANITEGVNRWLDRNPQSGRGRKVTRKCLWCGSQFETTPSRNKMCCSVSCSANHQNRHFRENWTAYQKYKHDCKFRFSLSDFPSEFDFGLIEKFGWYKAKNRGDNPGGVSRDHIVSIRWGYENNAPAEWIRHPANCQLLRQPENVSKGKRESITLSELKQRIDNWNKHFPMARAS